MQTRFSVGLLLASFVFVSCISEPESGAALTAADPSSPTDQYAERVARSLGNLECVTEANTYRDEFDASAKVRARVQDGSSFEDCVAKMLYSVPGIIVESSWPEAQVATFAIVDDTTQAFISGNIASLLLDTIKSHHAHGYTTYDGINFCEEDPSALGISRCVGAVERVMPNGDISLSSAASTLMRALGEMYHLHGSAQPGVTFIYSAYSWSMTDTATGAKLTCHRESLAPEVCIANPK